MIALALALAAAQPATCAVSPAKIAAQLALPYAAFDTADGPHAWRTLNGNGCVDAAVAILGQYSAANGARLAPADALELKFHIGQALAFNGRDADSIAYFAQATAPSSTPEWATYVAATLAFLRHDRPALKWAMDAYAKLQPGSMRLRIIEGFAACFDQPYAKAAHCGM